MLKIRITQNEFLHSDNVWATIKDQAGRTLYFSGQRRVRGSVIELTYERRK